VFIYLNHVIVLGDGGHLEKDGAEDGDDEFDRQRHAQPAVDPVLQVPVVHQQNGDGGCGHRGCRPVDRVETVDEIVVRVRHLHHAVPPGHVHAKQLLELGREHDNGHGRGEAADQRLGQHGAQHAHPKHAHDQLHETGHQGDGRGHLDGGVTAGGRRVFGRVRGHYFAGHQAHDGQHAQRYVTGRA